MKKLILLLAVVSVFSCKKKEDEPKTKINYVSYKVDGKFYETYNAGVSKDTASGFFMLSAQAEGTAISVPLLQQGTTKYNLTYYANCSDTVKKYTSNSGELEITEYKSVGAGSISSGTFRFKCFTPTSVISITDGIFSNIQSKDW